MAQLLFGGAATLSPIVYSYVVQAMAAGETSGIIGFFVNTVPAQMAWLSMYWIFAIVSLAMLVFIFVIKLPKVELKDDESVGAWQIYRALFKDKTVIFILYRYCCLCWH